MGAARCQPLGVGRCGAVGGAQGWPWGRGSCAGLAVGPAAGPGHQLQAGARRRRPACCHGNGPVWVAPLGAGLPSGAAITSWRASLPWRCRERGGNGPAAGPAPRHVTASPPPPVIALPRHVGSSAGFRKCVTGSGLSPESARYGTSSRNKTDRNGGRGRECGAGRRRRGRAGRRAAAGARAGAAAAAAAAGGRAGAAGSEAVWEEAAVDGGVRGARGERAWRAAGGAAAAGLGRCRGLMLCLRGGTAGACGLRALGQKYRSLSLSPLLRPGSSAGQARGPPPAAVWSDSSSPETCQGLAGGWACRAP